MQPPSNSGSSRPRPPAPETIAATSAPVPLVSDPVTVSIDVHYALAQSLLRAEGPARRVTLRVENVRSQFIPAPFSVFVNVPAGADATQYNDRFAFVVSTFGITQASRPSEDHPGNGLSASRDITDLLVHLMRTENWSGQRLSVTFVSEVNNRFTAPIEVGRVSLMLQ